MKSIENPASLKPVRQNSLRSLYSVRLRWNTGANDWVKGGSDSRLLPGNSLRHNFFANDDAAGIGVAELKLQCLPVKLRPESDAIGADEFRWPTDRSWSLNIPVWSLGPRPCFSINFWPRPEEYVQIEHRKWAQWVSNLVGTKDNMSLRQLPR